MKLECTILNKKTNTLDTITICEFKDESNDMVFVEVEYKNNETFFHLLIDEGYMLTNHYYPIENFAIIALERE